jgi:hypothetical protein
VTALRLARFLYDGRAVDAAVKRFAGKADFGLREDPEYWVVDVSHADGARERRVAGELGNMALGLTLRYRHDAAADLP